LKLTTTWNEKMLFSASDGTQTTMMDAKSPVGTDKALSPKQLCLAAIMGCTGMDVVGLLRKHKQNLAGLEIKADAPVTQGYPAVFEKVLLDFYFQGEVEPAQAIDAVKLSQSKYCGVSAMIAKACPIHFKIYLNDKFIHEGSAEF
jgi:putative redox protein